MKLTVFGSTGDTGRQLVDQALAAGHKVTAVAREPNAITTTHPNLLVVQGDVLDPESFEARMEGSDAVLSALGARAMRKPTNIYSQGTAAMVTAMANVGITRLIALSAIPLIPNENKSSLERTVVHPMLYRFFGGDYRDMRQMEDMLNHSSINWTIFRPSRLTNGRKTGRYRTAVDSHLTRAWSISRADLAAAMLQAVADHHFYHRAVAIAH